MDYEKLHSVALITARLSFRAMWIAVLGLAVAKGLVWSAVLPPWYDVDTLADWRMLQGHVAALRKAGIEPGIPHTEALFRVQ